MHTCMYVQTHTYNHARTHTHAHPHTHMYTHRCTQHSPAPETPHSAVTLPGGMCRLKSVRIGFIPRKKGGRDEEGGEGGGGKEGEEGGGGEGGRERTENDFSIQMTAKHPEVTCSGLEG